MRLFSNVSDPVMEASPSMMESMEYFSGLKLDRLPEETCIRVLPRVHGRI